MVGNLGVPSRRLCLMRRELAAVLALCAFAASCTGPQADPAPSFVAPSATDGRTPSPGATPEAPRITDHASFVEGLAAAGLHVREGTRTEGDQLFPAGRSVIVDGVRVSTYEYPSAGALEELQASISPDGYSVPTRSGGVAMVEWVSPPHFYAWGTLLVVYFGEKQRMLDALGSLLGPQFAGG